MGDWLSRSHRKRFAQAWGLGSRIWAEGLRILIQDVGADGSSICRVLGSRLIRT